MNNQEPEWVQSLRAFSYEEGDIDYNVSEPCPEWLKECISAANSGSGNGMYGKTGEANPFYGKHHTDATKRRVSNTQKERYAKDGHPWVGRNHSEESKRAISEKKKQWWAERKTLKP